MTDPNSTHHTITVPEIAAVQANRYVLGRMSYAVSEHRQWLISAWPRLSEWTKDLIQRDADSHFEWDDRARLTETNSCEPLGMDIDRREWEKVRALWSE